MSSVTNVLLLTSVEEGGAIQRLNKALALSEHERGFSELDANLIAGARQLECGVYVGAFDYLELPQFIQAVVGSFWKYPHEVQVLIKGEGEDRFRQVLSWDEKSNVWHTYHLQVSSAYP